MKAEGNFFAPTFLLQLFAPTFLLRKSKTLTKMAKTLTKKEGMKLLSIHPSALILHPLFSPCLCVSVFILHFVFYNAQQFIVNNTAIQSIKEVQTYRLVY